MNWPMFISVYFGILAALLTAAAFDKAERLVRRLRRNREFEYMKGKKK